MQVLNALVVRCNYGDESLALVQALYQRRHQLLLDYERVWVVFIDTGWASESWLTRVEQGEAYVRCCGFIPIRLSSSMSFDDLVIQRQQFPSQKFQWCANFLKGLPLMSWLDEHDPQGNWTIAIAKRQAIYRKRLREWVDECPFHGERKVWHPILSASDAQRDTWLNQAGFVPLQHPSLECAPCIHHNASQYLSSQDKDKDKVKKLEIKIKQTMFSSTNTTQGDHAKAMDAYTMGCGDHYGCGL